MPRKIGSGYPHDQAHVRDEPVIGTKYRSAQGVAAHSAVTPLQSRQCRAAERTGRTACS
jgi:hypothetical protein